MNFVLRLFLTFSSISFFVIIYLIQNKHILFKTELGEHFWIMYVVYLIMPFVFAHFGLLLACKLAKSKVSAIKSIEPSNNDFLANYLAFFFVALSVEELTTFWIVLGITFLFTFVSRVSYFNPVFLIFGYNFYYVKTNEDVKIMVISKKKLKNPKAFEAITVSRINDYTFIEGK